MTVSLSVFIAALAAVAAVSGAAGFALKRRARPVALSDSEAARRLAIAEQRLVDIAELAGSWVWEMDSELRFTYFSHQFRGSVGTWTRAPIGSRVSDRLDLNEPTQRQHVADLEAHRPFREFQYPVVDRNGVQRHIKVSGTPLFDRSGAFRGYRGIGSDVTAMVNAERQAADAQRRLGDAIESISAGFLLCDTEDRLVACNSRYRRWFFPGFEDTLKPGMSFLDILHHAQKAHPGLNENNWGPQWQERRLARRRDLGKPFEIRLPDGRTLLAVERGTEGGGVVSIYTDITEIKAHEKEIASKSAALEATFDNMSEGITMVDRDLIVIGFNRRFAEMFSFPAEALKVGMSYKGLLQVHAALGNFGPGDPRQLVADRLARARRGGRQVYVIDLPDGRIVQMRRKPMPDGGFINTYTDITDIKRHERELAEKTATLTATFDNMSEGVTVIGADLTLISYNARFATMFDFPPGWLAIGMPYASILRHNAENGVYGDVDVDEEVRGRMARARRGEAFVIEVEPRPGQIIQLRRTPLPGGGFINTYTDITDSKRRERELAEKSATLTATFDNMSEGVAVFGADLRLVSYNVRFVTMFEFPAGFLEIGMPLESILRHNAERGVYGEIDVESQVRQRLELARRGGTHLTEVQPRPGQVIQLRRKPLPGGGFINTYTDITDSKRRERELADKSALFEAVLDNMDEGVAMIDDALNLLAFNQRYVDLFDLPRDLMRPGVAIGEIYRFMAERGDYGPGDADAQVEQRVTRSRRFEPYTIERNREDGITLEIRSNPIPDGGAVISVADVTVRRRAERALRISEERYALAQRAANEGLWDWDIAHGAVYVSPRIKTILNLTDADVEQFKRGWFDYTHPEDAARYRAAVVAHLKGETDHYACEYRVRTADGTYRWVRDRGLALRGDDGRAYRMAGSVGDITAEVEAAQALRHAKDVAETANRTKSEFLANMSHELRTPLNAIIGFAEMMEMQVFGDLGNDHYREYIGDIHNSGQHLLNLINDILDVSKVEAGKIELRESDIDVADVIASCVRLVAERASTGDVAIELDVPRDLPALYADEHRVKQILLNLLSNGVKFTPPKGTVTVRARADRMQGFAVEVIDTGIGIAAKDISRAFEPFVQIDSALNRKAEGTGLGLPLSRALMALHGGSLDLISEAGKGTNVRVAFPAVRIVQRRRAS